MGDWRGEGRHAKMIGVHEPSSPFGTLGFPITLGELLNTHLVYPIFQ